MPARQVSHVDVFYIGLVFFGLRRSTLYKDFIEPTVDLKQHGQPLVSQTRAGLIGFRGSSSSSGRVTLLLDYVRYSTLLYESIERATLYKN